METCTSLIQLLQADCQQLSMQRSEPCATTANNQQVEVPPTVEQCELYVVPTELKVAAVAKPNSFKQFKAKVTNYLAQCFGASTHVEEEHESSKHVELACRGQTKKPTKV